ncbi:DUF1003 domain-containing protein [Clostridium tagluense]|uniref:Cyclic nucleotide-binding protein n=1 Tax=Clostridium tagluense TaxID=360422 RepID=A0A401UNC9_9CLOT|nr:MULTISPECIES: DUF1003 domain-containing protein [Clostridium]MBU3126796.1 DUF1003 domain-containing protein [Clostridium tagluense]MBW9155726.1 DUF1003 domain-containing protein [Clostridium tagluense]MBZ9625539.1 DUF1003 domain-containing protein [Clostridium sp. FP2]MCB2310472.1 DUF1003 domain-containing protein [Clostridium tagluense]MCB2315362.1 DUF1003 domain-containing protein [Clostridium tagluense]
MENEKEKSDTEKIVNEILEQGEIFNDIEEELLHELIGNKISKDNVIAHAQTLTFGNKMADKIAASVGSWSFIIIALSIIAIWIVLNSMFKNLFDPFPFILLNLVLSCTAAIQAPVIMMSQNRQEDKDRIKSTNDYKINLKSELIIQDLHKKMDILIQNQKILVENQSKMVEYIDSLPK